MGLYLSLHPDTDQEYTDHTIRLGWIGPQDPRPLDVNFFPPAATTYQGCGTPFGLCVWGGVILLFHVNTLEQPPYNTLEQPPYNTLEQPPYNGILKRKKGTEQLGIFGNPLELLGQTCVLCS